MRSKVLSPLLVDDAREEAVVDGSVAPIDWPSYERRKKLWANRVNLSLLDTILLSDQSTAVSAAAAVVVVVQARSAGTTFTVNL